MANHIECVMFFPLERMDCCVDFIFPYQSLELEYSSMHLILVFETINQIENYQTNDIKNISLLIFSQILN